MWVCRRGCGRRGHNVHCGQPHVTTWSVVSPPAHPARSPCNHAQVLPLFKARWPEAECRYCDRCHGYWRRIAYDNPIIWPQWPSFNIVHLSTRSRTTVACAKCSSLPFDPLRLFCTLTQHSAFQRKCPEPGSLKVGRLHSPNFCNSPFFTRTLILHTTISDP